MLIILTICSLLCSYHRLNFSESLGLNRYSWQLFGLSVGQCAENVIGYMTLPLGIVGPLKLDGKFYTVPMATTEGCLLASTNRGCSALKTCGVTSQLTDNKMTRAPAVTFPSIARAVAAKRWIEDKDNFDTLY